MTRLRPILVFSRLWLLACCSMQCLRDCRCHSQDSEEEDDDSEDDDSSGTEIAARLATFQATSPTVRRTIFRSSVTTRRNSRRLALRVKDLLTTLCGPVVLRGHANSGAAASDCSRQW